MCLENNSDDDEDFEPDNELMAKADEDNRKALEKIIKNNKLYFYHITYTHIHTKTNANITSCKKQKQKKVKTKNKNKESNNCIKLATNDGN